MKAATVKAAKAVLGKEKTDGGFMKPKPIKKPIIITLTVECNVDPDDVDYDFSEEDLMDQFIKVKSGLYENRITGYITNVSRKK
jgi:hypothetical protein